MTTTRKIGKIAGILYFITWVTSIAGLAFYGSILKHSDYLSGSVSNGHLLTGAFLEIILAIANIGTALALYPIVRRASESLAMGYVALRTLESALIAVGVLPILALVTLRQDVTDLASSNALGRALVSLHNWSFVVGPNFICAADTLVLAFLLFRSGLVARFIPILGLVGGSLLAVQASLILFGVLDQSAPSTALLSIPVFAWEISLGTYMFRKGFKVSALAKLDGAKIAKEVNLVTV